MVYIMFTSLKSKIISLIVFIMAVTALIIIFISSQEIGDAMLAQQNRLSKHVLSLIELNIKGEYSDLISKKIYSVTRHKKRLNSLNGQFIELLDRLNDDVLKQRLSRHDAQQIALDWVSDSKTENAGNLFVTDNSLHILAHPDPNMKGEDISKFTDIKNKTIEQMLAADASGMTPVVNVVNWQKKGSSTSPKSLICLKRYHPWGWIVGATVNIENIEVEASMELEKIIETLNRNLREITIGSTGFAFLFDNAMRLLAMPDQSMADEFQISRNSDTGRILLEDMVTAAIDNNGTLFYRSDLFKNKEMVAYISFFRPLGWYIGVTVPVSETKRPAKEIASKQSTLIGMILFCSILFTTWLVSRISKPLNILAERVKDFSSTDLTRDEDEDTYITTLSDTYNDEVGRLASSFAFMKKQLKDNIRQLIEKTAENERIEGELTIARDIQIGLLPKIFPPFPENDEIDIFASLEPAKEVGGDLYDFYFIKDNLLCFTIGDVSGKGVPAALMMAITKTLIKTSASKHISPADIMIEVNDVISSDNPQSMFVTLLVGILDLETGRVCYSNGGHNPPILISQNRECRFVKEKSGPMVGIMNGIAYKGLELTLAPGESLFMYTDGVTEAQNTDKCFYSEQTLLEKISALAGASSKDTVLAIKSELKTFAGSEPQFDDIAMLMLTYRGFEDAPPVSS